MTVGRTTPAGGGSRKIPFHRPSIGQGERDAVIEVLDSGWLTTGRKSADFEEAVRAATGAGYAVAVNSATAALHLILEALGIRSGDEVVVPTYTFAACGEVVRYLNARPRLADVDPATFNATAETIAAQLRPETRAIMVVHYGGALAEVVRNPRYSTVVGLLLSGIGHHQRQQIVRMQGASFKQVFDRMKAWVQGNF